MKKFYFLLIAIFTINIANAQSYLISFVGSGASTAISSVYVQNLTQNTTVTLNGGDVLQLVHNDGINELNSIDGNLQVYPNPMKGQAELSFYAKQAGNTQLIIYDIAGKEIMQTSRILSQGIHIYKISGLIQGMYFINVVGENYSFTSKLNSLNISQSKANLEYLGSEKNEVAIKKSKSPNATISMAYATGDRLLFKGISGNYSNVVTDIPTSSKTETFNFVSCTDCDNNNYATVQIGTQVWMAENLKTTKYRNCDAVPNITDNIAWSNLSTGAYCNYNNTPDTSTTYGRLYNWYSLVDSRNLCPTGWHVPADSEWTTLTDYLGGESSNGGKLKEVGLNHWATPNTSATNETGFTALPAGFRYGDGSYSNICYYGSWWSSTVYDASDALRRSLSYNNSNVYSSYTYKTIGFSVRCLKD